ncbi:MAG TPA: outer membrane lipoprotein carrier protein LolA [Azospirillaceae bacterium]|nr:outer membrane lipoprotein carrier protein LolA [Azospirillaceae bacterium]
MTRSILPALLMALGLSLAGTAALPPPAQAAAKQAALTDADRADLARVEDYLRGVETMRSKFLQVVESGETVQGTFYLSRPGRMRIDYDPPVQNFIVADGKFVFFWDAELKQQSNAPIGSTLADFILRPDLKLAGDVTVTDVERQAGVLEVTLVQTKDPGLGRLTLVFEDQPLRLRKWRVVDAQNQTTEVALLNPEAGVPLKDELFYFREPQTRRKRD